MYWQVYLHKTGLVAENILVNILKRAKELAGKGVELFCSSALRHFLYHPVNAANFTKETLEIFSKLDDYDVLSAIKEWVHHEDKILALLAKMIVDRKLLKIEIQQEAFKEKYVLKKRDKAIKKLNISEEEVRYFVFHQEISNQAYDLKTPIYIVNKKGKLKDISKASDQLNLQALTIPVVKHFICYPK
jgi:HD superfamily phosphohydrolase